VSARLLPRLLKMPPRTKLMCRQGLRVRTRPLATSSQNSPEGQFGCKAVPKDGDDPPDFILNGGDQVGTAPTTTHLE